MLIFELSVTAILCGVIWLVQLTHYPSFRYIADHQWKDFHKHHTGSISIIVMPLMLVELALSFYLLGSGPKIIRWVVLILVLGIWANTFFQAVPLHRGLEERKDLNKINQLVKVNGIRTLLWTVKFGILFYYFLQE